MERNYSQSLPEKHRAHPIVIVKTSGIYRVKSALYNSANT